MLVWIASVTITAIAIVLLAIGRSQAKSITHSKSRYAHFANCITITVLFGSVCLYFLGIGRQVFPLVLSSAALVFSATPLVERRLGRQNTTSAR